MAHLHVITGATGLLGSHIAEQLRATGEPVRALVRAGSDAAFLRQIGVEVVAGDLKDAAAVRRAIDGAGIVYHAAAKVSDWGRWEDFRAEAVTSTTNVVEACRAADVGRLLHVSSISVYGHPKLAATELVTEETPLGRGFWMWDYYPRAKLLAEEIAWKFPRVTVVRPSWIYGPRDRVTIPRVVTALLERRVPIIGTGDNLLNIVYAGDVAAGALAAARSDMGVGQAYNLCSTGEITQRDLLNALTDELGLPRITRRVPYGLAKNFAFIREAIARALGRQKPPPITRRAIYLIGRSTHYSIARAQAQLGWSPATKIDEGVRRSLEWLRIVKNAK